MKSFKFRLQKVLEQRERQEKVAQQDLASAEGARLRGEQLLAELHEVRQAILTELGDRRMSQDFDPLETRTYQEYLQTIAHSVREQERYVRDLTTTCEAMKLHLISASQNRQALASVKERDHKAHFTFAQRQEQAFIDDLATARYAHLKRAGE